MVILWPRLAGVKGMAKKPANEICGLVHIPIRFCGPQECERARNLPTLRLHVLYSSDSKIVTGMLLLAKTNQNILN